MRSRERETRALCAAALVTLAGCGGGDAKAPTTDGGAGARGNATAGAASAAAGTATKGRGGGGSGQTTSSGGSAGVALSSAGSPAASHGGSGLGAGGSNPGTAGNSLGSGGATGSTPLGAGGSGGDGSPGTGGHTAAGGAAGAATSLAGAGGNHANGGATGGPYPDLRFSGLVSAVELAPLRLATNGPYPGKITIASGGVDALCGANATADIATNAETQLLRATGMGGCDNVRIIFTMCEGLYRIVAKKSAGIASLADLAGKHVMAPSGASSAYYLTRMLAAANLTAGSAAGDVTVVNGNPNGSTFSGGSAPDAATIWEPGIEQAAEELGSDAIVFEHDQNDQEVYRELFNLHTTTDVLADPDKRRAVVELVRELITASASLSADPSVAYSLLTGPTGVSASVLAQSMKYERFAGTLVSDVLDVMTEEEPWRANIDGRSARSRDELAKYIDDSVLADATAGM
ncbi:MAG TPA: ABC transporter substrate-binding protein [Polyangiaceae bacterium]|nr:ABC transporter substrate-binding protein [Polyangiaceae bacterium]